MEQADKICTYVSKANPGDDSAYEQCVDNVLYNYYAQVCKKYNPGYSEEQRKEACKRYRDNYLYDRASMTQIPERGGDKLWKEVTANIITTLPFARASARRRGSARKAVRRSSLRRRRSFRK